VLFAFGVYQALFETMITDPGSPFAGSSSAEIGLIGGLATGVLKIGAPLTVAWTKHFGPKRIIFSGGLLFGLGSVLASFGTSTWHFQLSQGLLMGIGSCLSFMPSITVTPTWFGKHRGSAMGIVSAGTGIGGLVFAPITTACVQALGFRNSLRLTGGASAALICTAALFLSEPPAVRALRRENSVSGFLGLFKIPLPTWKLARQPRFLAQFAGGALQNAAYYTPVVYLATFAETLDYSATEGANLIAVSNACNAVGKIVVGVLADRLGRFNALFATCLLSTATTFGLWIPSAAIGTKAIYTSRALLISNVITYGLFASAYQSLFPATMGELFSLEQLPNVNGLMYMIQGLAGLAGTPLAGLLTNESNDNKQAGDFVNMAILVGTLLSGATLLSLSSRHEAHKMRSDQGGGRWRV
jgi:MFS family permease